MRFRKACAVSCGHGRGYLVRAGVAAVNAVVFIYERLVSVLLRPQRAGYIFRAIHHAAALVIEAQNGRHHVRAAFRRFQRRRTFFLIPDTTGLEKAAVSTQGYPWPACPPPAVNAVCHSGVRKQSPLPLVTTPSATKVCCFIPGCAPSAPATSWRSRTSSR